MGNPVLQLGNSANWEQLYSTSVNAVSIGAGYLFTPIPPITVPVLIESHIIAISITSANAKDTWHFGGLLSQKINLGITVGGLPDADGVQKHKLYLDRLTLLILPKLTSTYSVEVEPPKWFNQISVILWQYIGPESDTTEDLINEIKNVDLPRIEAKIDAL
ncbi:MAG: hypothetical protein RMX63_34855 [Aulosira sp. ZfuCHP01]|nr:hypothetical protein [Aulosira sp. ZfuVER01]MDZ8056600.1 hypothetical protein [Aulosira sp. ZfuCHP01]